MELETDKLAASVLERVEKYGKFTDVSDVKKILERYFRTYEFRTKAFLMSRAMHKLRNIQRRFPMIDFSENPPEITELSAGVRVGDIMMGDKPYVGLNLSKDDLNKNVLVIASVGYGKTSLIYNILSGLKKEGVTYLVFDLKRDYASLALEENTVYLDNGNMMINPLDPPPGVSKREWAAHVADAISHSFALLMGSRDFLLDSLIRFYEILPKDRTPSLPDFLVYLESAKVKNRYIAVIKGRIKSLLSSTDVFSGYDTSLYELDNRNVVMSIDGLGLAEQSFLVSMVLFYIYHMNVNDPEKRKGLYKVIAIDDSHTILDVNKEKDYAMGIPLLHHVISKMRELGVGFLFADQQASSLISSAIQNSNTKFIGRLNLTQDFKLLFGESYGKELEEKVHKLAPGEFVMLSPKIRPSCTVRVDRVRIEKNVDRDFLCRKNIDFEGIKPQTRSHPARKEPEESSRDKVLEKLRLKNIDFTADEVGILITKPKKAYITFAASPEDLSRLFDTKFDSIIDIVPDGIAENDVKKGIANIRKIDSSLELLSIKVCTADAFSTDLL